ncbi:hypothetical protein CSUB_C0648 [Candidatus Caldarchaeum subterraneum]|uniref:DUF2892 domain-containing protein n=1 Tax=Caldiarchaeum subterraneum TaxID=311458 RepID=E6N5S0_CALS0|nr:hypothetical protein HGMM_F32D08C05 [Candidatus Caldarchaeum subterraneum]BAJ47691.1 hypothetical protein HGMM_F09F10C13 [Candidatus Caldarchaeum subterraneum]BAJ50507.1 hypothetical protein CSUB_C0648 [Candidatus Caldarchaeum subterraneum]
MNLKNIIERIGLALSFAGLALLFQPFMDKLLLYGFIIMSIGGFMYVYTTYIPDEANGKTMAKWLVVLVGTVVFFVALSIYLVPILVV